MARLTKPPIENSRRNNPYLCSEFDQVKLAVEELYAEYARYVANEKASQGTKNYSIRSKDVATIKKHIENLILDLYSVWHSDPTKFLGYSRDHRQFRKPTPKTVKKGIGAYYDHFNKRPMLSKTFFPGVIDFLVACSYAVSDLAKSHKETAAEGLPRSKFSSRIRAKQKLVNLLHKYGVNWAAIQTDLDLPFVVLRSDKKKSMSFDPSEHPEIQTMQGKLRLFNGVLDWNHIDLLLPEDELDKLKKRMNTASGDDEEEDEENPDDSGNEDEYREPFELTNRFIKRKFINDFESAGRFYGGWWQGCPREYRKFITINHHMTAELDFATIQPHILYAKSGSSVPADSYLVGDWDKSHRDIYKKAFNQLVNSKPTVRKNLGLLAPDIRPDPLPKGWDDMNKNDRRPHQLSGFKKLTGKGYDKLLTDMIEYHKPIDDFFFSQSWRWLQRLDSDIAEGVMDKLMLSGKHITALPIHDSFIIPIDEEGNNLIEAHKAMIESFHEVIGVECKIDLKEFINSSSYSSIAKSIPASFTSYKAHSDEWIKVRGERGVGRG